MPVKYKISIFLEGKNNDNFSFANSFFRKIESSYPEVITAITPLLEDTLQNWKENFKIKDFKQEFQIVSLSIPIQKEDSIIWEITFETIHDPNHQFTVGMSDMEAKWLNIDG
ncbi:hypothetical protein [Bernardetia sp.]|uniref:hypothetical protein n=1 Tax=Bernardetia sp. TaxID=1937974 RepID=UPI0025BECEF4|nr:hypothetical protein [Bernardetia sp.]